MEINEFIEKFAEAIEVEDYESLTPETRFRDLNEWSSISVMLAIAFFDENFGKELSNGKILQAETIQDLFNIAIS